MLVESASGVEGTPAALLYQSCVRIGGVSLALRGASPREVCLSHELESFRHDCESPNIEVNVKWVEKLRFRRSNPAFDSGSLWTLSRDGSLSVFDFTSPSFGNYPYKRLHSDGDFCCAQLVLNGETLRNLNPVFPLEYPADELLITNYLAGHGLGVEVHGCGLIDAEVGGLLFLGHSGAGKSTTTKLWKSLRNPEILSDDRIILRLHNGELWMYGTPWHGEAAFASAATAKLSRIFILQHGERNEMVEMPRSRAVGEMFARCFPPFHSAAGLERTIEFLNRVTGVVPCYEFRFVPHRCALQAVLDFHDRRSG